MSVDLLNVALENRMIIYVLFQQQVTRRSDFISGSELLNRFEIILSYQFIQCIIIVDTDSRRAG